MHALHTHILTHTHTDVVLAIHTRESKTILVEARFVTLHGKIPPPPPPHCVPGDSVSQSHWIVVLMVMVLSLIHI